jgi:hypothetical protein
MSKSRLTSSELDARLKFTLGITLGAILFFTTMGILYALIFVEQPLNGQSENDKMFFNVLGSVATFITGTLAGLLIGKSGGSDNISAPIVFDEPEEKTETILNNQEQDADLDSDEKYDGEMPEELPVDEDWDKED